MIHLNTKSEYYFQLSYHLFSLSHFSTPTVTATSVTVLSSTYFFSHLHHKPFATCRTSHVHSDESFSAINVVCQNNLDSLTLYYLLSLVATTMPIQMFSYWYIFCFEFAFDGLALVPNER